MASTAYPVNHPAARKEWSNMVFKEALKRTWSLKFMGEDTNSLVQIVPGLTEGGDRTRVFLRMQLTGSGVAGDGTLEGNEEALSVYSDDVSCNQLRHAVRSGGRMSEQRVPFSVRNQAMDGLADWWANRIDTWLANQLGGYSTQTDTRYTGMQTAAEPDSNHAIVADAQDSTASLVAASTFTLTDIDNAVEKAKTLTVPIRPMNMAGEEYFVAFLHPYQITDLRTNTTTGQWIDIQKAAMTGGDVTGNPIFTGAEGVYNKTIIHEWTRVPPGATVSAITTRRAIFAGAQAAAVVFGEGHGPGRFDWTEELFDFQNQLGVAAGCIGGLKKLQFNSEDLATVTITTAAVAHT